MSSGHGKIQMGPKLRQSQKGWSVSVEITKSNCSDQPS
ncbi:hypothetical protein SynROS8604_01801 [Synechococcus sp. ROS8604]|nr:hypothetical protein SynROS8604_01801 [Synechococcus sp. ROS8604]